jgi:hypothetical protein
VTDEPKKWKKNFLATLSELKYETPKYIDSKALKRNGEGALRPNLRPPGATHAAN